MESPGEPGERIAPGVGSAAKFLRESGVDLGFLAFAPGPEGFEIAAILAIEALRHGEEDLKTLLERQIAHHQGSFGADHGRFVGGHGLRHRCGLVTDEAQRAISNEPGHGNVRLEERSDLGHAFAPHLREQPNGAGREMRIRIGKQGPDRRHGGDTGLAQPDKTTVTHIRRGTFQGGDLSLAGGEIELRHGGLETLRCNPIDRAGDAFVEGAMSANTAVEPIGHVDRTIRSDGDIAGSEHRLQISRSFAAKEIGAGPFLRLVRSHEIETLQLVASAIGHGQIAEDNILPGLAGEEEAVPFRIKRAVLVVGHPGGRTATVDIAGGHGARIFLTPFGGRSILAGTFVGAPGALSVGRGEAGVAAFEHSRDAAGGRVVVVALEDVTEGGHGLLVAVAEVVPEDGHVRAIGIHAGEKAADPDVAVVAPLARDFLELIRTAHVEVLARAIGELRAHIALIEIPLTIRSGGDAVEAVVVLLASETGEQDLASIDPRFDFAVAVLVGVDEQIGRL